MQTASGTLAAAIAATVRKPIHRVSVDWDKDGYGPATGIDGLTGRVVSITLERTLKGDLPDQVRLAEGYAAAQVTLELAGDPGRPGEPDAAGYFSRFNTASPLTGKERLHRPITVELGMQGTAGPEYLPAFTGLTSALPVDSKARTAQLVALDGAENLRAKVNVPTVVADDLGSVRPGLGGGWLIDYILRRNAIYATPPGRAAVRMLATMRGSAYPEVGAISSVKGSGGAAAQFTADDRLAMGAAVGEQYRYTPAGNLSVNDGGGILIELAESRVDTGGIIHLTNGSDDVAIWRDAATDKLKAGVRRNGGGAWDGTLLGPSLPHTTPGAYIGVHFAFAAGTITVTWRVNATSTSGTIASVTQDGRPPLTSVRVAEAPIATPGAAATLATGALGQVQVTAEATPGTWGNAFVPTAVLDPSLNKLTGILPSDARDSAGLITEVAAAEQGMFFFTEAGLARFRNRAWWASAEGQTVQATLTAQANLTDLAYDDNLDAVRNSVTARAVPVVVGPVTDVWTSPPGATLLARSSIVIWVDFQATIVALDTLIRQYYGTPRPHGQSRIRANTNRAGDGTDWNTGGFTARWDLITATTAKITLTNNNATTLYLVEPGGAGGLVLAGRVVGQLLGGQTVTGNASGSAITATDQPSIDEYGEQTLDLPDNPWRQDADSVAGLVGEICGQTCRPRPVLTNIGVVGDPRLQLGDRVRIQDPQGLHIDGEYWITGISTTKSGGKLAQRITARQATTVLRWGVGRWDVNTWG
jgi:hypothetical protein